MSLYIDNGKTVKHFCTNKRTENAIITLLKQMDDLCSGETREGYTVKIVDREEET